MRQSATIGKRINEFDNLDIQTVETFNLMFPECPLKRFHKDDYVIIGEPAPNNSRVLYIGYHDYYEVHKMFSDVLYNVDRDVYNNEQESELDEMYGYPV